MPFLRLKSEATGYAASAKRTHDGNEKRNCGRLQCPYLDCYVGRRPFGEVVDLSARGIRVFRRGGIPTRVGQMMTLTLKWHEDQVCVSARIRRMRKLGFRKYDIGLEFVNPSPSVQAAITELARGARFTLQFMTEHRNRDVA